MSTSTTKEAWVNLLRQSTDTDQIYDELAQWRATFPGKSAADVARLLGEQRPLTAEEKAWVEKAWQEYKASAPKI